MVKTPQNALIRTARLLDLVPYLNSHQGIQLSLLAKKFEVSQAQMVADLTTLWMCGLPGYTPLELMDLSFESGFVTIHNAETLSNPRSLRVEESIALLLGLDLVIRTLPRNRSDLIAIAQELVVKLSTRSDVPSKLTAVSSIEPSLKSAIEKAIEDEMALQITYHSMYSDELSIRTVFPIELRSDSRNEYLWAFCQNACSFRLFRLDRIRTAKIMDQKRNLPVEEALGDSHLISFSIRANSRAREVSESFNLEKVPLNQELLTQAYSPEWIRRSVLGSSGSVEIVQPSYIRAEIAESAALILDRYML